MFSKVFNISKFPCGQSQLSSLHWAKIFERGRHKSDVSGPVVVTGQNIPTDSKLKIGARAGRADTIPFANPLFKQSYFECVEAFFSQLTDSCKSNVYLKHKINTTTPPSATWQATPHTTQWEIRWCGGTSFGKRYALRTNHTTQKNRTFWYITSNNKSTNNWMLQKSWKWHECEQQIAALPADWDGYFSILFHRKRSARNWSEKTRRTLTSKNDPNLSELAVIA